MTKMVIGKLEKGKKSLFLSLSSKFRLATQTRESNIVQLWDVLSAKAACSLCPELLRRQSVVDMICVTRCARGLSGLTDRPKF